LIGAELIDATTNKEQYRTDGNRNEESRSWRFKLHGFSLRQRFLVGEAEEQ